MPADLEMCLDKCVEEVEFADADIAMRRAERVDGPAALIPAALILPAALHMQMPAASVLLSSTWQPGPATAQ